MSGDHEQEHFEAMRQEARDAIVASYLAEGDTANADRLRAIALIQDRLRREGIGAEDVDQLLVILNEASDEIVEAQAIFSLVAAERLGQIPANHRQRVIEAGRAALMCERSGTRHGGCALLVALDARSARQMIALLLEDRSEDVRQAAAQILAQWDGGRSDSGGGMNP